MNRTIASLAFLLLVAAPLWAQIELPAEHQLGRRIVASTPFEAKVYDWSCPTADVLGEGGKAFIWPAPGKHTLTLIAVTEQFELKRWSQDFEVTSDPVPPTPATLRELVTEAEAKQIATYLRLLASQVGQIQSAEHFWAVWNSTTAAGFPVRGNGKLDAALKARLEPALEAKKNLSTQLLSIADEFDRSQPEPPTPTDVAPIPETGLNVLIVEETADRLELPEGQRDIITSTEWVAKLRAKGGDLRIRDPSDEHPNDLAKWNKAMDRPRSGLPWVIISNGTTGYEGPLPNSLTEWEALLAKYGG